MFSACLKCTIHTKFLLKGTKKDEAKTSTSTSTKSASSNMLH